MANYAQHHIERWGNPLESESGPFTKAADVIQVVKDTQASICDELGDTHVAYPYCTSMLGENEQHGRICLPLCIVHGVKLLSWVWTGLAYHKQGRLGLAEKLYRHALVLQTRQTADIKAQDTGANHHSHTIST